MQLLVLIFSNLNKSVHDGGTWNIANPVVVLAPLCIGMKGFSSLNSLIAPDAWHRSRTTSAPLGQLAGE
eukprot:3917485-Prorocentrum_lima.AAC.1